MATSSALVLLCVFLACDRLNAETPLPKEARRAGQRLGPLPRAFGSPQNVDPKVDCVIKNLAWEYAKKLIPRVRDRSCKTRQLYGKLVSCLVTNTSVLKWAIPVNKDTPLWRKEFTFSTLNNC